MNVIDMICDSDRIENDRKSQREFVEFWARCVDVMEYHEKMVPNPSLWDRIMCVGFCAATWEQWKQDSGMRLIKTLDDREMQAKNEQICALKSEISKLKQRLKRAKNRKPNERKKEKNEVVHDV